MRMLNNCIVDIFATFRRENGLSLREAEKLIGITNGYLSRVESRRIEPSPTFCFRVTEVVSKHFEKISQQNQGFAGGASKHPVDE